MKQPVCACQSCRHFALDALLLPKHVALNLGNCPIDGRRYAFRFYKYCCSRYEPTARRAACLSAMTALTPKE